jgi:NAD(P)-dependent dehydrogenase (short-subunit alcohol dehydrogenase family)
MKNISDMSGKVALITGAAAGLGRATALHLARAGAAVSLVDIDEAGLTETARLAAADDVETQILVVDLSKAENCRSAVSSAVAKFGRLDALCNVAGVFLPNHTPEVAEAELELILAVNLAAPFYLIQAAIPHLLEQNGAVVNVTSCAAQGASLFCYLLRKQSGPFAYDESPRYRIYEGADPV